MQKPKSNHQRVPANDAFASMLDDDDQGFTRSLSSNRSYVTAPSDSSLPWTTSSPDGEMLLSIDIEAEPERFYTPPSTLFIEARKQDRTKFDTHAVDKFQLRPQLSQRSPRPDTQPPLSTEDVQYIQRLAESSPQERDQILQAEYSNHYQRLETIHVPRACQIIPELRYEIFYHYLRHTIFTCTVWTNYDPVEKAWYSDDRVKSCGILRISASMRKKIEAFEAEHLGIVKAQILVCTPFRTLALIELDCGSHIPKVAVHSSTNDPKPFSKFNGFFMEQCAALVDHYDNIGYLPYLSLAHLDDVVLRFRREVRATNWYQSRSTIDTWKYT